MSMSFFSERYGYKEINREMLKNTIPKGVRIRIWNVLYKFIFYKINEKMYISTLNKDIEVIVSDFFKLSLSDIYGIIGISLIEKIKKQFFSLEWYEVYDFIEFLLNKVPLGGIKINIKNNLNVIFEEEKVPYRIIGWVVTPLINNEEVKEIEEIMKLQDKFNPVREHIQYALKHFSDKQEPNYADSIKQSISALESLVQILLEKKGTLGKLIDELNVHPALKEGFKKLYGWTSDDGGIRHGKCKEKFEPGIAEARYMLVTVSAFINYLINKYSDSTLENF